MASVTLSNGTVLESSTSTQEAMDEFAKSYDATKAVQKVDAAEAPEGGEAKADAAAPGAEPAPPEPASADEIDRGVDGRFTARAKSQRATAEDVPRIQKLASQRREAEERAALLEQETIALKQRLAALEQQAAPKAADPVKVEPAAPAQGFTVAKPQLSDFPTYEEFNEALVDWKIQARDFAREQQARETQARQEGDRFINDLQTKYQAAATKFAEQHADFQEVVTNEALKVERLINAAIISDDKNGPKHAYLLAKNPDLLYELNLLAEGKAVNLDTVASMQRVLAARLASAVPAQTTETPSITKAAPPIKPVRGTPTVPEVSITELTGDAYLKARLPQLRQGRRR